ncbi:hypothetical protein BP6252_01806 [Coleophoma cylindrospora]|uniref:FAS1 domain-containing protein n=1 Tax=Coleophoma cylindrospora TaxID=1849047 RepID=A0A3D8SU43_9HELO|nr:hypothetical protein BP6252_01806 [Coleophoma cylindrospora]
MKFLQTQKLSSLVPLLSLGSARSLLDVLQAYPELTTLQKYVNASSTATNLLANANDFTFLAPSNTAIEDLISANPNGLTDDLLQATLQYSLLQGGFPALSITKSPQFVASNLKNASYANVTSGQVVELLEDITGTPQAVTGNKSVSTLTTTDIICVGGIVHIIDAVLSLPVAAVLEITNAHLDYFVAILNVGQYLSSANAGYVNAILDVPDVTYFIPNSASALAKTTELSRNSTPADLQALFQYHVVPGFVEYSPFLENGMTLATAQGTNVTITIQDGQTYVNAARIINSDYMVANGVMHVIDSLLNSSNTSPPPKPTTSIIIQSTPIPTISSSTTASTTPTASAIPSQAPSSKSHTPKATIGIAVGVTGAVLIGIAASIWYIMRRKQRQDNSIPYNDQGMSASPSNLGKFFANGSTIQRQENPLSGIHSTGINDLDSSQVEGTISQDSPAYSAVAYRPSIPLRSPSRLHQDEF